MLLLLPSEVVDLLHERLKVFLEVRVARQIQAVKIDVERVAGRLAEIVQQHMLEVVVVDPDRHLVQNPVRAQVELVRRLARLVLACQGYVRLGARCKG